MHDPDKSMPQGQVHEVWDTWWLAFCAAFWCWNPVVLAVLSLENDGLLPQWVFTAIYFISSSITIPNALLAIVTTCLYFYELIRIRGKKDSKRKLRRLLNGMKQARERALQSIVTLAKGNVPYRTKALPFPRPHGIRFDTASDRQCEEIEHLTAIDRDIATLEARIAQS